MQELDEYILVACKIQNSFNPNELEEGGQTIVRHNMISYLPDAHDVCVG